MRSVIASGFVLISLAFLMLPAPSTVVAAEACECKGCGCKGGSGWRGPDGTARHHILDDLPGEPAPS